MESDDERRTRNRRQQVSIYGAPLRDVVANLTETYQVSRSALAQVIGVSAPMLSQVASADRVKLGNPAAVHRLQELMALVPEVRTGQMSAQAAMSAVSEQGEGQVLTRTTQQLARHGPSTVQQLVRALGSAEELTAAARMLDRSHPAIAEFLRVYGAGSADQVREHYRRHMPA